MCVVQGELGRKTVQRSQIDIDVVDIRDTKICGVHILAPIFEVYETFSICALSEGDDVVAMLFQNSLDLKVRTVSWWSLGQTAEKVLLLTQKMFTLGQKLEDQISSDI